MEAVLGFIIIGGIILMLGGGGKSSSSAGSSSSPKKPSKAHKPSGGRRGTSKSEPEYRCPSCGNIQMANSGSHCVMCKEWKNQ